MLLLRTLANLRQAGDRLRSESGSLALVPTMGALHEGHGALVKAAVASGARVVASIFVNPLQFGPQEDLARYPREETGDLEKLEAWGCHAVWLPDLETMYPLGNATTIEVEGPAERWEGAARPGHFRGVATVCAKLFGQVRPDRAYFGEKDWQQVQVVRRMVTDLLLPLEVVAVPTVRESDGLALSSRNRFLTGEERGVAPRLFAELSAAARALATGAAGGPVLAAARQKLTDAGFTVDYLVLVDGQSLTPLSLAQAGARLIVAARLGSVRLLDNVAVEAG